MMRSVSLVVAATLVAAAPACKSRPVPGNAAASAAPSFSPPDPAVAAAKEAAAAKAQLTAEADALLKSFGDTDSDETDIRRERFRALRNKVMGTDLASGPKYRAVASPALGAILDRLDALDTDEKRDAAALDEANIPERPTHQPPAYDGAFQISGVVKKCYRDGIVVLSNGKYYAVMGVDCPDTNLTSGYVETTGGTTTVDIGRDGREAIDVKLSDRESAQDDRRAHQEALREYEATYQQNLRAYQTAVRENGALVARIEAARRSRDTERTKLLAKLDLELGSLAMQAFKGEPLRLEEDEVAAAKAPAADSTQPPSALPTGQPGRASTAALAGTATPSTATTTVTPAAAATSVANRRACLMSCVADCGGDANCQHRCVSAKCR